MNYRFPKSARFKNRSDFIKIMKSGERVMGPFITIDYRFSQNKSPRLGITVTKKYGKAHLRNAFKRRARETFRKCYRHLPESLDIHIRPNGSFQKELFERTHEEFELLLKKNFFRSTG